MFLNIVMDDFTPLCIYGWVDIQMDGLVDEWMPDSPFFTAILSFVQGSPWGTGLKLVFLSLWRCG